jgi:hypothetical protein
VLNPWLNLGQEEVSWYKFIHPFLAHVVGYSSVMFVLQSHISVIDAVGNPKSSFIPKNFILKCDNSVRLSFQWPDMCFIPIFIILAGYD